MSKTWTCQMGHLHCEWHCPLSGEAPPFGCDCTTCRAWEQQAAQTMAQDDGRELWLAPATVAELLEELT